MTATSLCGSCGAENPSEAIRCTQCADYLDPALAPTPSAEPRQLERGPLLTAAGVATAFLLTFEVLGASFSMRLLPAGEPIEHLASRLQESVDTEALAEADALAVIRQLGVEARLRAKLDANELREPEASSARQRIPARDQSTVLGLGGVFALLLTALALGAGSIAATAWARTGRLREVGLGLLVPLTVQLGLWLVSVDMDLAAVAGGRLWLVGTGPAFEGAPVLLLVMSLVASTALALAAGAGLGALLDHLAGRSACPHCEHRFVARKHATQCPACLRPLAAAPSLPLHAPGGGMTRASAGAERLLCTLCAKTYAADHCPTHPQEPLLDPRRDDVRFGLLELDTSAGTTRFSAWTQGLGEGAPTGPAGGVCTLCAAAYSEPACPHHPHEPLLDPTREDVRQRLFELDVGRDVQRFAAWTRALSHEVAATGLSSGRGGLCMECAKTYDGPRCAVHPHEPLLNPHREDVRLELIEADDRRRRVVGVRLMFAAFFIALGLGFGASTLIFDGELAVYLISGALAGLMAVARVLTPPLSPRRFGAWTGEGEAAGDLEASAREELLAPLARAARKALARARIIVVVTVAGVALGTGAALALGVSWGAGAAVGGLAALLLAVVIAGVLDEAKGVATSARQAADAWRDPYG